MNFHSLLPWRLLITITFYSLVYLLSNGDRCTDAVVVLLRDADVMEVVTA